MLFSRPTFATSPQQNVWKRRSRKHCTASSLITSQVPGAVYQFLQRPDGSYCLSFCSNAIANYSGSARRKLREDASRLFAAIHPDDLDDTLASIEASARNLTTVHHEFRVRIR